MNRRAVSLYSGAGGFDLGFEHAGFEIAYANELDASAAETWMANRQSNRSAMARGDISKKIDEIASLDDIDLVFGGPPCQGFSIAGKMRDDDSRNTQVNIFMDVVEKLRPRVFVMENVKALGSHPKWANIREGILDKALKLGYDADYKVFQLSEYGVPENRERVLFIGVISKYGKSNDFFDSISSHKKKPKKLRELLNDVGKYNTNNNPMTCMARITIAKNPVLRGSPYTGMLVNGSGRPLNIDSVAPTLTASMGGNRTPIVDQQALNNPNKRNWFEELYISIVKGELQDSVVPDFLRRLTIKEAAAIQTFPKTYQFCGSKCSQYRQIGNAVPPEFSKAVAQTIDDAYFK